MLVVSVRHRNSTRLPRRDPDVARCPVVVLDEMIVANAQQSDRERAPGVVRVCLVLRPTRTVRGGRWDA